MKMPMGMEMEESEIGQETQSKLIQKIIEDLMKVPMAPQGGESMEEPEGKAVSIEIEKKPMGGDDLMEDEGMKKAKMMAMKGV